MTISIDQSRRVMALVATWEPVVRNAFLKAISDEASRIDFAALVRFIENGDELGAIDLLRIDRGLFPVYEAVRNVYIAGGLSVALDVPKAIAGSFRFDGRHLRAEAWVQREAAGLVQGIADDTLVMARDVLRAGLVQRRTPPSVARQIVGTLNRATGRREGGFLGLTAQQTDSIISGQAKLASGDPALMREYLQLKLRDKRYDAMVKRSIAAGKPVASGDLEKIIASHKAKALRYRGEIIARNEAFTAQAAGREEAYKQALERPNVADVLCRWQHNLSQEPREDHVAMDGTVISLRAGETFNFPDASMKHPHDPAGGARHSIGCRCIAVYRVRLEADR